MNDLSTISIHNRSHHPQSISLSTIDRTETWQSVEAVLENEGGCTVEELHHWLDTDPMLKAVVVQQHQGVFHPKIFSIPLGHVKERVPQFYKQVTCCVWKYSCENTPPP
jgi:hypothetical protein